MAWVKWGPSITSASRGSQLRAANCGALCALYHSLLCSVGSPVAGVIQRNSMNDKNNNSLKPLLWLSYIPCLFIITWPFAVLLSIFAFDAPGSEDDPMTWFIVLLLLTLPITALKGARITRSAYEQGNSSLAYQGLTIGYSNLVLIILLMLG